MRLFLELYNVSGFFYPPLICIVFRQAETGVSQNWTQHQELCTSWWAALPQCPQKRGVRAGGVVPCSRAVLFTGPRRVPSRAASTTLITASSRGGDWWGNSNGAENNHPGLARAALHRGLLSDWDGEDSLVISVLPTWLHPVPSQDSCGRGIPTCAGFWLGDLPSDHPTVFGTFWVQPSQ